MFKYNYEKGIAEPEDMSREKNLEMRIYEPPLHEITISWEDKGGTKRTIEIEVDEIQKKRFERQGFDDRALKKFLKIAKEHGKIQDFVMKNKS